MMAFLLNSILVRKEGQLFFFFIKLLKVEYNRAIFKHENVKRADTDINVLAVPRETEPVNSHRILLTAVPISHPRAVRSIGKRAA